MSNFLYNLVIHTLIPPALIATYLPRILFRGKYRRSIKGKLGILPPGFDWDRLSRPRVWLHAVSVGEVVALSPLASAIKERLPRASIVISTGTETGQDKAQEMVTCADGFFYLPLDFPYFVNRVIQRMQPDLFVLLETELWPNLIQMLKRNGSKIALANGRISDRSFPRYRLLRRLFSSTIGLIDLFLMSSELDAERIGVMGADETKIIVTGNTKFDAALGLLPEYAESNMRDIFDLKPDAKVFVAGSTHPGEHEIVLDTYCRLLQKFPELILILVPRHLEKTPEVVAAIEQRRLSSPFLRTWADKGQRRGDRNIIIVDRIGELFQVFSVASVVFMGGSLVSRGGQNILEPAAWGKVVLFGPSMEDFREARDILLRTGSGIEVHGVDDLYEHLVKLLDDPEKTSWFGEQGRDNILKHIGSAQRNAEMLIELLNT
jgi:3-deoxy-D-manno-octulosonic-acid transferase